MTPILSKAVLLTVATGLASVAVAAGGKPFLLGKRDVATAVNKLIREGAGPALDLRAGSGPSLGVNSDERVRSLNADKLDGKDADQLLRAAFAKDGDSRIEEP